MQWTPTLLVYSPHGKEHHRYVGFAEADDLLAQLDLGLAKVAFNGNQFVEAEKRFRNVVEKYPKADATPEALYWAAVSAYKATGKGEALGAGGRELQQKYPGTEWAKKGSVWVG